MSKRYLERGVSHQKRIFTTQSKIMIKVYLKIHSAKLFLTYYLMTSDYCNIMHADGAGTKSALAYLYWKETDDLSIWRNCSGCIGNEYR